MYCMMCVYSSTNEVQHVIIIINIQKMTLFKIDEKLCGFIKDLKIYVFIGLRLNGGKN